jgi:uncharacterized protein (TIGR01777 family)
MKKVTITGGTGFIGRALVSALSARGDRVTLLTRGESRGAPPDPRFQHWDPLEALPERALAGSDAVVHLAGEPVVGVRWTESAKLRMRASRVRTTEHLVSAMERLERRPAVFVCASAVGYYGAHRDEVLDEASPPGSDFLAKLCEDWEEAAIRAEWLGVRVVRARLGIVLGKGGGALLQMARPFRAFVGGPIGSGTQFVSWVHLDDTIGALVRALDDERLRGPVNVVAPNAVTNRALSDCIGRALRRPSSFPVPTAALRLLFGEGAEPLVNGQRVSPRVLERAGYSFRFTHVEDAVASVLSG